jgi:hypothetical protein
VKLIVSIKAGTSPADLEHLAAVVRLMPNVGRVDVELPALEHTPPAGRVKLEATTRPPATPGDDPRITWWLCNALGICVAEIGASMQEASILQLLLECRGTFDSRKTLAACLRMQFPAIWGRSTKSLGVALQRLRKKLLHTDYRLADTRGGRCYGLERRVGAGVIVDPVMVPHARLHEAFVVPFMNKTG